MVDNPEVGTVKLVSRTRSGSPVPVPGQTDQRDPAALNMDLADLKAAAELESSKWRKMIDTLNESASEPDDDDTDGPSTIQSSGSELTTSQGAKPRRTKLKVRHSQSPDRIVEKALYQDQLMACLRNLTSLLYRLSDIVEEDPNNLGLDLKPMVIEIRQLVKSTLQLVLDLPEDYFLTMGSSDASN